MWNEGDMKTNAAHTFGKILQDARESKDLSLGQAAELLDVPKTSLWRWENNETKVDAQRLVDIAAAYELSIPAIFEGRVMAAPSQMDLDRIGTVVEKVEETIQLNGARPRAELVRAAVVEILRLETSRVLETKDSEFDMHRYHGLLRGMLYSRYD